MTILDPPQQGLATMQNEGKFSKREPDDVLFDAPKQLTQNFVAHQLGLVIDRGVAEPIAIGAIDIASRSDLYKELRYWLAPKYRALRLASRHVALPSRAA